MTSPHEKTWALNLNEFPWLGNKYCHLRLLWEKMLGNLYLSFSGLYPMLLFPLLIVYLFAVINASHRDNCMLGPNESLKLGWSQGPRCLDILVNIVVLWVGKKNQRHLACEISNFSQSFCKS